MTASAASAPTTSTVQNAQAFWKVTLRLMPYLALLWCLAWIDRVNIGFAKLTMLDDLKFSEAVYGLGAGVFFPGYFIFEVPSNLERRVPDDTAGVFDSAPCPRA